MHESGGSRGSAVRSAPQPAMLLFGVAGSNGTYSRAWRLVSVADKPELYLVPLGLDRFMHASYHPGGRWHFTVKVQGKTHRSQIAGADLAPGFAHLFRIQVPPASYYRDRPDEAVMWLDQPPGDRWLLIELVHELPGANRDSWPGKNHGSALVGRVPVADGSSIVVVAHDEEPGPESGQFSVPDDEQIARARAVPPENLRGLLVGRTDTGVTWVMDGLAVALRPNDEVPAAT